MTCSISGLETQRVQAGAGVVAVESRFFHRVFYVFAGLALVSLAVSLIGGALGARLSMGGHTNDTATNEIVIGNDVLAVPANKIRYPEQRRNGVAGRLDLYALWPDFQGFTEENRAAFNNGDPTKTLIFISFELRSLSRDMSGRLDPIYSQVFDGPGVPLDNGLTQYTLRKDSGFVDESILVGIRGDGTKFVVRCLTRDSSLDSIADCNRDIHVGDDLAMVTRFPSALLDDWNALDLALSAFAAETIRTNSQ